LSIKFEIALFYTERIVVSLDAITFIRKNLFEDAKRYKLRMQKAMRLMNIRLDNAIKDITGKSGKSIITAILAGERDAKKLADLADWRVKKSKEEISKALTGDWRDEYVFELKQSFELYYDLHEKITETENEIKKLLEQAIENSDIDLNEFKPEKKKLIKTALK